MSESKEYQLHTENWVVTVNEWVGSMGMHHVDYAATNIYDEGHSAITMTNTLHGGGWCIDLNEFEGIPLEVLKVIIEHIEGLEAPKEKSK